MGSDKEDQREPRRDGTQNEVRTQMRNKRSQTDDMGHRERKS